MNNKDEEIRNKTLQSYKGKLYECSECGYLIIIHKGNKPSKIGNAYKQSNWCIMCLKSTYMNMYTPEEIEKVFKTE